MSLAILFHVLCAQHVSDINISIIRSLRLCYWITTLFILLLVWCVLEIRCCLVWVVSVLQAEAQLCASVCNTDTTPTQPHRISNTQRTKNITTNVVSQQHSRKLMMMDILMSETCWTHKKWNTIASDIKLVFYSSTMEVAKFETVFLHCVWNIELSQEGSVRYCNICNIRGNSLSWTAVVTYDICCISKSVISFTLWSL